MVDGEDAVRCSRYLQRPIAVQRFENVGVIFILQGQRGRVDQRQGELGGNRSPLRVRGGNGIGDRVAGMVLPPTLSQVNDQVFRIDTDVQVGSTKPPVRR
jgi:hypothetical protein